MEGGGFQREEQVCVRERVSVCVYVCVCAHHRNSQKRCRSFL